MQTSKYCLNKLVRELLPSVHGSKRKGIECELEHILAKGRLTDEAI